MKGPISSLRSTLASPMIRRHFLQFAVAAAVAAVLSGLMHIPSANATLLNFDFSFTNTTGNVDGTVTGEIFGLTDNAVSSASKIIITSAPDQLQFLGTGPFPITVMPEPGYKHSFTVEGGDVVATDQMQSFFPPLMEEEKPSSRSSTISPDLSLLVKLAANVMRHMTILPDVLRS
jgi:hypothetical protein